MIKKRIIPFIVVALLLLTSISTFTYVINNYKSQNKNTVISIQNVASKGKSKATIKDYEKLVKKYEDFKETSFCSELSTTTVNNTKITPVLINHNYLKYNNISYTDEGITNVMEKEKSKTAVVSKTFGKKIAEGKSPIGKTFIMNDERYRITGVFDDKKGTVNDFFKDNKERVYINYTSVSNYENEKLTAVSCIDGSDSRRQFYFLGFDNFQRVNFDEKNLAVNDFTAIISFILTIITSVYLIRLWLNNLGSTYRFIKEKHNENYLCKFIGNNIPSLIIRLIIFLILPLAIFVLFYIALKDFHLVYNYIDKENLFSISHMLNTLSSTIQTETSTLMGGNPYFLNLYNGTLVLGVIFLPIILLLFFFTYYLFNQVGKESKVAMYLITVSFIVITIISLIVAFASDSSFTFLQIIFFITALFIAKCLKDYFIRKD